jgi:hypothetical protein
MILVCRRFRDWTVAHISNSAVLASGYLSRPSLIATFTCYCGCIGWNVLYNCACFVRCNNCSRKLPARLTVRMKVLIYCGFPCETQCTRCCKGISKENACEFIFFCGSLRCCNHLYPIIAWTYEWYDRYGKHVRSLFADELSANGPISRDIIKRYDPRHRILTIIGKSD